MSKYSLGQRVTMTGTAVKHHDDQARTLYIESTLPQSQRYPAENNITYTEGVIVGWRTTVEGKTYPASYDEQSIFMQTPGSAKRVWLVAFDLRRKPVMCFDNQVEANP